MSEQQEIRRVIICPSAVRVVRALDHLRDSCHTAGLKLQSSGLQGTQVSQQIYETKVMVEAVLKDITNLTITPEFFNEDRGFKETPPLSDGGS
ncbi:hypothetical protein [Marinomonas sp. TW1]|uniref:hypothetical protein n=1 Tax=Marinomonas sp. TW1 TaxID=1561203 RepID=UPI0007AF9F8F|nr:hypothetical protein [Marinomonas sp. TW1]KZN12626.1 hypothetical protein OA79_15235 [Marinomonas sp. TW1]